MQKPKIDISSTLISVLVPMYNSEKTITRCIKSIIKQTYKNLEIVLVDDGSSDNTYNIAKQFADIDSRIKLLHKNNEGSIGATRNFLLNNFSGDYFVWIDSDDVVNKKYIETLFYTLTSTSSDLAICRYKLKFTNTPLIDLNHIKITKYTKDNIFSQIILNQKIGFMLWNKIYKKELVADISFLNDVKYGEDFAFVFNYVKKCSNIAICNKKLYKYIVHPNSETTKRFSDKKMTFVNYLETLICQEDNFQIKKTLLAWLAFTGNTFLFLSKKSRYNNYESKKRLYDITHSLKNEFFTTPNVRPLHKFIMSIGLKTWAKRPPKET